MQLSIGYFLLFVVFLVDVCQSYRCKDRFCFIEVNANSERILNCTSGESQQDIVDCLHLPQENKIILTTKDDTFMKINKIAPGAFRRLISGISINKLFINKFQLDSLDANDLDGLVNMLEIRLENPKTIAPLTFLSVATKTNFFILTISCLEGNKENSFGELYMKSNKWRYYWNNCKNKRFCENLSCNNDDKSPSSRIMSTNITEMKSYQTSSFHCKTSSSCNSNTITKETITKPTTLTSVISNQDGKSAKLNVKTSKSDSYYEGLMWIVLVLTTANSIIIFGILIFLIIWWRKLSTSAANKKHTIILEDGDDTKYLKLSPYA